MVRITDETKMISRTYSATQSAFEIVDTLIDDITLTSRKTDDLSYQYTLVAQALATKGEEAEVMGGMLLDTARQLTFLMHGMWHIDGFMSGYSRSMMWQAIAIAEMEMRSVATVIDMGEEIEE